MGAKKKATAKSRKPAEKKPDPSSRIETRTETRQLRCKLTPEDRDRLGMELARQNQLKAEKEDDKKKISAEYSAQIKACEAEIKQVAAKLSQGYEHRPVDVEVTSDFGKQTVTDVRTDTGEELGTRKMRQDELQRDLPLTEDQVVIQEDDAGEGPEEE